MPKKQSTIVTIKKNKKKNKKRTRGGGNRDCAGIRMKHLSAITHEVKSVDDQLRAIRVKLADEARAKRMRMMGWRGYRRWPGVAPRE